MSLASQPQHAGRARRYPSTLLQATVYQEPLKTHGLLDAFPQICHPRGETAGRILVSFNRTFKSAVLISSILACFPAYRSLLRYVQPQINRGVLEEGQETASIERATAQLTTHFLASETDLLRERELQNRCALHLSVF